MYGRKKIVILVWDKFMYENPYWKGRKKKGKTERSPGNETCTLKLSVTWSS